VTAPAFDGRRVAITQHPLPGLAPQAPTAPAAGAPAGTARVVHEGDDATAVDATAGRRSLLVLTDVWFPGWTATVDGRPASVQRVDYLLRGVELPPGRHRIELRYRPASFRVGWIVSLVALLVLLALAVLAARHRRRPRDAGGA
jgi:hypothetical protein